MNRPNTTNLDIGKLEYYFRSTHFEPWLLYKKAYICWPNLNQCARSSSPSGGSIIIFCWLGHLKMSFYYPTSHSIGKEVLNFIYINLWSYLSQPFLFCYLFFALSILGSTNFVILPHFGRSVQPDEGPYWHVDPSCWRWFFWRAKVWPRLRRIRSGMPDEVQCSGDCSPGNCKLQLTENKRSLNISKDWIWTSRFAWVRSR